MTSAIYRIAIVASALGCAVQTGQALADDPSQVTEQLRAENQALREDNERLRTELTQLQSQLQSARDQAIKATHSRDATEVTLRRQVPLYTRHDPSSNTSTVRSEMVRFRSAGTLTAKQWLAMQYSFAGQIQTGPVDAVQAVIALGRTSQSYQHVQSITFLVDGSPMTCPVVGYTNKIDTTKRFKKRIRTSEQRLVVELTTEQARLIALGQQVWVSFARYKLPFAQEHHTLFGAFYARAILGR